MRMKTASESKFDASSSICNKSENINKTDDKYIKKHYTK